MTPKRIQRRRTKGSKLPPNTSCVTRPGKYGNQWSSKNVQKITVLGGGKLGNGGKATAAECVQIFAEDIADGSIGITVEDIKRDLAGKNLACFCRLCDEHRDGKPLGVKCDKCAPCHADVLLELANT